MISACINNGLMQTSGNALAPTTDVNDMPATFSGGWADFSGSCQSITDPDGPKNPSGFLLTASNHTVAETCGDRLRAKLRLGMREDGRLPIQRERANDCPLNAVVRRLATQEPDTAVYSETSQPEWNWCVWPRLQVQILPQQHSEDSGFLFLSDFTDAIQSKRGLGWYRPFLGGGSFLFPIFLSLLHSSIASID